VATAVVVLATADGTVASFTLDSSPETLSSVLSNVPRLTLCPSPVAAAVLFCMVAVDLAKHCAMAAHSIRVDASVMVMSFLASSVRQMVTTVNFFLGLFFALLDDAACYFVLCGLSHGGCRVFKRSVACCMNTVAFVTRLHEYHVRAHLRTHQTNHGQTNITRRRRHLALLDPSSSRAPFCTPP
jgi:hypothetical protein